jgi:hypothetical protein
METSIFFFRLYDWSRLAMASKTPSLKEISQVQELLIFGITESEYEFVISVIFDRPLNPPILDSGGLSIHYSPQSWGARGAKYTLNQQRKIF